MLVLILDEMDALMTKEQAVLYHLFELPELKQSRAVLVGVANNIDLTVRLLPRLQVRIPHAGSQSVSQSVSEAQ